jgi:hypothetical protein
MLEGVPFQIRREAWLHQIPHFGKQVTSSLTPLFKTAELGGKVQLLGHRGRLT